MSCTYTVIIRSKLSKVIPASDLGKVFSFLSSLESAVPLFSGPLMTLVYNTTIETFSGGVYIFEAGIYCIMLTIISYIFHLVNRHAINVDEDNRILLIPTPEGSRRESREEDHDINIKYD